MIRIRKSNLIPESLQKEGCTEYNREDVKKQLLADQYENTMKLLSVIFNGTGLSRKILEERFYEYYLSRLNSFKKLVDLFLTNPTEDYRKAIIERLQIDREFLGFKYRIIKNNPTLEHEFGEYINWNNINKYNNNL